MKLPFLTSVFGAARQPRQPRQPRSAPVAGLPSEAPLTQTSPHQRPRITSRRPLHVALVHVALLCSALVCSALVSTTLTGCSLDSITADSGGGAVISNSCQSSSQCDGGTCLDGICQATTSELTTVLLEVTPPSGVPTIAGVRFTQVVTELPAAGKDLDIELAHISLLAGAVSGSTIPANVCVPPVGDAADTPAPEAPDGSLPVRVTLVPRERLLGLSNPSHTREITTAENGSYELSFSVPPGDYDVYVEPLATTGDCVRPPHLALDRNVRSGNIDFDVFLPAPQRLDVTVVLPGLIDALDQWTLEIVDRDTGRLLSNSAVLEQPTAQADADNLEYEAVLAFSPIDGDADAPATELVRLSPPEGVTAPTIYVERGVVELFEDGKGVIDQLTQLPEPVAYTGRVKRASSQDGAQSAITLIATELQLVSPGTVAAFARYVQTDEDGVFSVDLLPGTYVVVAQPSAADLAQTETELTVSGSQPTQAGKDLVVEPRSTVSGTLHGFDGSLASDVPLQATPFPTITTANVLSLAQGEVSFPPRAESDPTLSDGFFEILADPGHFHLIARPQVSSAFPWGVRLDLEVQDPSSDLGTVVLSLPRVLSGKLTSSDVGTVPDAIIRAYAYVADGEVVHAADGLESASAVVNIGEAQVDASGHYQLLLPSSFD